jgi:hypothetical protein
VVEGTPPRDDRATCPLPAPTYQWVLCDDGQVHAVWDDTILSCAMSDGDEAWIGVCVQRITMNMGQPKGLVTVCSTCIDAIPPDAVQAPWRGKTL